MIVAGAGRHRHEYGDSHTARMLREGRLVTIELIAPTAFKPIVCSDQPTSNGGHHRHRLNG